MVYPVICPVILLMFFIIYSLPSDLSSGWTIVKNISMAGVDAVTTDVTILDSLAPKLRSGSIL